MANICQPCAILKIGLWNGADTDKRGALLYRSLLQDAMRVGVRGGTVWSTIEGSRTSRSFRTVESEVASNELPVLMEFVDQHAALAPFIVNCREKVGEKGIVVVEAGQVWGTTSNKGGDSVSAKQGEERDKKDARGSGSGGSEPSAGTSGRLPGATYDGLQVQIFTLEHQRLDGRPVYQAVAEFLRQRGILWISTNRAISGYGAHREVRQPGWLFRKSDVPIVMTILDRVEKLEGCLPELVEYVGEAGFVVSKPVVWHWPAAPNK